MEVSKTDKVGCVFVTVGEALKLIDDKFGDVNGDVKLDNFDKVVEAASLLYATFKQAYACSGKTFEINVPGAWGAILKLILDTLDKEPKPVSNG